MLDFCHGLLISRQPRFFGQYRSCDFLLQLSRYNLADTYCIDKRGIHVLVLLRNDNRCELYIHDRRAILPAYRFQLRVVPISCRLLLKSVFRLFIRGGLLFAFLKRLRFLGYLYFLICQKPIRRRPQAQLLNIQICAQLFHSLRQFWFVRRDW